MAAVAMATTPTMRAANPWSRDTSGRVRRGRFARTPRLATPPADVAPVAPVVAGLSYT